MKIIAFLRQFNKNYCPEKENKGTKETNEEKVATQTFFSDKLQQLFNQSVWVFFLR